MLCLRNRIAKEERFKNSFFFASNSVIIHSGRRVKYYKLFSFFIPLEVESKFYPRFARRTIRVNTKNNTIHANVLRKPLYTAGSTIVQPRVSIERRDEVAKVSGSTREMYFNTIGIPSIGQMTPDSKSVG